MRKYFLFSDQLEKGQSLSVQMDIFEILSSFIKTEPQPLTINEFLKNCLIPKIFKEHGLEKDLIHKPAIEWNLINKHAQLDTKLLAYAVPHMKKRSFLLAKRNSVRLWNLASYLEYRKCYLSYRHNGYLRHYVLKVRLINSYADKVFYYAVDWRRCNGATALKYYNLPSCEYKYVDRTVNYTDKAMRDTWKHLTTMTIISAESSCDPSKPDLLKYKSPIEIQLLHQKCGNIRAEYNGVRMGMESIGSLIQFFQTHEHELDQLALNRFPKLIDVSFPRAGEYSLYLWRNGSAQHMSTDIVRCIKFSVDVPNLLDKIKQQAVRDKLLRVTK